MKDEKVISKNKTNINSKKNSQAKKTSSALNNKTKKKTAAKSTTSIQKVTMNKNTPKKSVNNKNLTNHLDKKKSGEESQTKIKKETIANLSTTKKQISTKTLSNKNNAVKGNSTNKKNISKTVNKNNTKEKSNKINIKQEQLEHNKTNSSKKKSQINIINFIIFLIIYLETITKIMAFKTIEGTFLTLVFSIPVILIIFLMYNIFKEKGNKITCFVTTILLSTYYGFMCIFYKLFSNVFSMNTLGLASDIGEFKNLILETIIKNIPIIILYLLPLILLIIFKNYFEFKRSKPSRIILSLILIPIFWIISLLCLLPNKNETYSAYNLYYNINSEIKTATKFGIATFSRMDLKRIIFGFDEQINIEPSSSSSPKEENPKISYNKIEINFDDLINAEKNNTIKNMLTYFKNSNATNKNEYTGMFKDKNLIFILAEGFNMIAVDKELTPTLYKLTHEGFVFNNFYSPVFLSTTGGEFQATTGLIPTQEILSNWKKYTPSIKYALGNSFENIGYQTQSYHNWTYTYYKRNKTMPTLGFDDYMGCGNGIEKLMSCKWLPSDIDMMNVTLPMYKDYDKFVTYYVSVSGHAPYAYKSSGNSIALKNTDLVKDLPYSNNVKAYLATQIEFDRALETLINSLKEEGILDNTVISFAGDHYPYTLTMDEVNELSTYERDATVEVNRSNFVIWNSAMKEKVEVDKVGSQIDILPTLLNLFGIEYDSRLIVGKDILSSAPGLAVFSNRSWVSDYGTYRNGKFIKKENKVIANEDEYINEMNNEVNNRFTLSNSIIKYNMYEYILK